MGFLTVVAYPGLDYDVDSLSAMPSEFLNKIVWRNELEDYYLWLLLGFKTFLAEKSGADMTLVSVKSALKRAVLRV